MLTLLSDTNEAALIGGFDALIFRKNWPIRLLVLTGPAGLLTVVDSARWLHVDRLSSSLPREKRFSSIWYDVRWQFFDDIRVQWWVNKIWISLFLLGWFNNRICSSLPGYYRRIHHLPHPNYLPEKKQTACHEPILDYQVINSCLVMYTMIAHLMMNQTNSSLLFERNLWNL